MYKVTTQGHYATCETCRFTWNLREMPLRDVGRIGIIIDDHIVEKHEGIRPLHVQILDEYGNLKRELNKP